MSDQPSSSSVAADKIATRRAAMARRAEAHAAAAAAGEALRDNFLASAWATSLLERSGPGGAVVSAYLPIRSEIDPTPLMLALLEEGHRLCVPVIDGAGLPLRFRQWVPGVVMVPGTFGTRMPETGDWLSPDLLLVPLLAFDAQGWRLGYGGGFYDRTLEGLRARGPVCAIGLAYAAQEMPAVPIEPTDQRLDAVLTEAGLTPT